MAEKKTEEKSISRRKFIYAGAGAVVVAAAAGGAYYLSQPSPTAPTETAILTTSTPVPSLEPLVFDVWPWGTEVLQANVKTFEEQYNEKVNLEVIPGDFPATMETKLRAGGDLDLMFNFVDSANRWYQAKWLTNLEEDPLLPQIKSEMYPSVVDAYTADDGSMIGLNYASQLNVLFRNVKMLKEAGYDQNFPTTWNDLIDICVSLKKGKYCEYPFIGGFNSSLWFMIPWMFWGMAHGLGDRMFDEKYDPTPTFDKTMVRILEILKTFWDKKLMPEGIWSVVEADIYSTWQSGAHAFLSYWDNTMYAWNDPAQSKIAGFCDFQKVPEKTGPDTCFDGPCIYTVSKKDRTAQKKSRLWDLLNFVGYRDKNGEFTAQKRYQRITALWSPFPELAKDPEVRDLYVSKWLYKPERFDDLALWHGQFALPRIWRTLWAPEWQTALSQNVYAAATGKQDLDKTAATLRDLAVSLKAKYA